MSRNAACLAMTLVMLVVAGRTQAAERIRYGDRSVPIEQRIAALEEACRPYIEHYAALAAQSNRPDSVPDLHLFDDQFAIARDSSRSSDEREKSMGMLIVLCFSVGIK